MSNTYIPSYASAAEASPYERSLQIGVVGSMADLGYSESTKDLARELGEQIAKNGAVLVFGAEKDAMSLPTEAALAARRVGGVTLGVTYEKGLKIFCPTAATVVVATGLVRGGGREMTQSLSCDGIVAIGGGSGTLNELTVAYQANIPAVMLKSSGGWSDKLADSYLDERRRYRYLASDSPAKCVTALLEIIMV